MAGGPSIVALSTSWGSTHGGINSFNTELCAAFAQLGCLTTCVVLDADSSDLRDAQERGVKLIALESRSADFGVAFGEQVVGSLATHRISPDLLIGHDLITGPAMLRAHSLGPAQGALRVVLHHMHYLSYKALEGDAQEADEKNSAQRELLGQADIIFAVGPKLKGTAEDMVRHRGQGAPRVVEIVPGLPNVAAMAAPRQSRFFFAGRLTGRTGRLKQVELAIAAFGRALALYPTDLGQDPMLTLLGADGGNAVNQRLKQLGREYAKREVNLLGLPFTKDRHGLLGRLSEESGAMLLSIHEGFGLTAWEAIGAAVPLIISKNSGVYELLRRDHGGTAVGCLHPVEVKASAGSSRPAEEDVDAVAARIAAIARSPVDMRRDATKLLAQLRDYTWESTARRILREAGLAQTRAHSPSLVEVETPSRPPRVIGQILFDVYDPACAPYCVDRDDDHGLAGLSSSYHLWLWGDTGMGKTTALRRILMSLPSYWYISLASCIGSSVPEMIEQILIEMSERTAPIPMPLQPQGLSLAMSIPKIAKLMANSPTRTVHIDEIPIESGSMHGEFCKALAALIIEHAGEAPSSRSRIAVCSLESPEPYIGQAQARVRERLAFIPVDRWSEAELDRLIGVATRAMDVSLDDSRRTEVVSRAGGSPRFVKSCLRKLVVFSGQDAWPFERILAETEAELAR